MKVLIVDDEPIILNGLVKIIDEVAPLGTEIRAANNMAEAIAIMKMYLPDVTITDLHMPEKNGFELIEAARADGLCDHYIILTGYEKFDYARRALRANVVDYLLKPVDKEEIAEALARIAETLPSDSGSDYTLYAQRILAYIEKHYMHDISLEQLGERMGLHPHYISRLFKKETGDNLVNYLNALRIREAKKLLKMQCHLPVSMIGQRVGFENRHYFSKVFKKYTGVTPAAYRQGEEQDDC